MIHVSPNRRIFMNIVATCERSFACARVRIVYWLLCVVRKKLFSGNIPKYTWCGLANNPLCGSIIMVVAV